MALDIVTSRLPLNELTPADAPALYNYRSHEEVTRFQSWLPDSVDGVMNKHRVVASVDPRNGASMARLRRVGMRQEAQFRQSVLWRGERVDDVVFGLLQPEWKGRRYSGGERV